MIAKIDSVSCVSEVISSINFLVAIRWVAKAWGDVKPTTMVKCFKNAGILAGLDVHMLSAEDPFQDIDRDLAIGSLIATAMGSSDQCSAVDYIKGDNDLAVCVDLDDDKWEENFMDNLTTYEDVPVMPEEESDHEDFDLLPPSPKIKSYREALQSLEDIHIFLDRRQLEAAATTSYYYDTLISIISTATHVKKTDRNQSGKVY